MISNFYLLLSTSSRDKYSFSLAKQLTSCLSHAISNWLYSLVLFLGGFSLPCIKCAVRHPSDTKGSYNIYLLPNFLRVQSSR